MPALPDSAEEKWQYTQHAKVKHELLAKYLMPWAQITGSGYGRSQLTYVDGFAGRGQYFEAGGLVTVGSPIIAMRQAPEWLKYANKVAMYFIERDPDNFANLQSVVRDQQDADPRITVVARQGTFADSIDTIFSEIPQSTPAFFMIDPFGFGGVPFEAVKRILARPRSEVFFTLMVRDMVHYLTAPNAEASLTALFGTSAWKAIRESGGNRELELRQLYVDQLRNQANTRYIWTFRVCMDQATRTLYYLVHAANHWKGCQLMKGVMYNQGGQGIPGTFAFLGPQDVVAKSQLNFFVDPDNVDPLKELLLRHFRGRRATFTTCQAETIHLDDNPFIERHYRAALKDLEAAGTVRVQRVTSKTVRGLAGDDIVIFPDR